MQSIIMHLENKIGDVMKEKFYCYKISNTVNDKLYIGITKNISSRWGTHKFDSKRSKLPLYRAMRKYGFSNFKMTVIKEMNSWKDIAQYEIEMEKNITDRWKDIAQYEIEMIKKYSTFDICKGYNMTQGGEGPNGVKRTKEHIKQIKENSTKQMSIKENRLYLSKCAKKQMSNPENREMSKNGAIKQWEDMSDDEKEERANRLSLDAKDRWKDPLYRKLMTKKLSKPIMANGVKYKSVKECAKALNLAPNTISSRCGYTSDKWKGFYYI